jgi:PiT family inorganic phosphate transporter
MLLSPHLLGGVFLGWSLGANDAANVFGTAVSSGMLRFRIAAALCAFFVLVGALAEGGAGIRTIGGLFAQSIETATLTAVGAALAVTAMTWLRIPSSASQALVGAVVGVGLVLGGMNLGGLPKVVLCWVGTPTGALPIGLVLYRLLGLLLDRSGLSLFAKDVVLRWALIVVGCYGAYALGANNVANATAVYFAAGMLSQPEAALIGGLSIALGAITFGRPVMQTVGRGIVRLDPFSAFVVVLAAAITVHVYAWVGVPVSTSQAVVGAVVGVGLTRQASAVSRPVLIRVALGWLATPVVAAAASAALLFVAHLSYLPPA